MLNYCIYAQKVILLPETCFSVVRRGLNNRQKTGQLQVCEGGGKCVGRHN